ncbi:hypothetical protein C8Q78DRAFT_309455 [Trametes maxima]|nr:hypothetical protein C8Q78DRAFT_309455 [Trametes maxima]
MALRTPFFPVAVPLSRSARVYDDGGDDGDDDDVKDSGLWADDDGVGSPDDLENTPRPLGVESESAADRAAARDLAGFLAVAAALGAPDSLARASEGFSHIVRLPSASTITESDYSSDVADSTDGVHSDEESAAASDDGGSESDDDDDSMQRLLAFANRGRASGSSLPTALAQLARAVDTADEVDEDAAKNFISGVAGVIREERKVQQAVSEILQDSLDTAPLAVPAEDGNAPPEPEMTEAQRALQRSLARIVAFRRVGAKRLDSTLGYTPEKLKEKRAPEKSLRHHLLRYLCERDISVECSHYGMSFKEPETLHVDPDVIFFGDAGVAEMGVVGDKVHVVYF